MLALAVGLGWPSAASAQGPSRAAQLFDAGISDLKLERYATACAALEESYGIEENPGTLIALADCLERWGKLHSAHLRFEQLIAALSGADASASSRRGPQLDYARAAVARLAPAIPRLELHFASSFGPASTVLLDGRALSPSPPEQALGVDPGPHHIETSAPGHERWRLELELGAGERRRVEVVLGRALEPAAPPSVAGAGHEPPLAGVLPVPHPERGQAEHAQPEPGAAGTDAGAEGNPWRTLGWGLGGLGVVGIGVGAVAGIMVLKECPSFDCASPEQRTKDLALVTDIGLGVGVAALAASAILLLTTDAPAASADESAGDVAWRPQAGFDARGGWLGVSHTF